MIDCLDLNLIAKDLGLSLNDGTWEKLSPPPKYVRPTPEKSLKKKIKRSPSVLPKIRVPNIQKNAFPPKKTKRPTLPSPVRLAKPDYTSRDLYGLRVKLIPSHCDKYSPEELLRAIGCPQQDNVPDPNRY